MASNKKGQYNYCVEYAKHLRKYGKKLFWSKERLLAKKALKNQK